MEIFLIISLLACVYFFVTSYMLYKQNQVLKIAIVEEVAKRNLISDKDAQESFLKFVSDSREWAFGYIEDVQKGLKDFIDQVEPHIEYYDQYGIVVDGMITPHDKALKVISKEFKELKKLLPEENND